ncbi:MAG TPA: GNAT family protein [Blastocatellia bacterium]|nr:GNAT family protein [Blastocatellia bacterium]
MPNPSKRSYPWKATLKDKQVTLRLMRAEDRDALLGFAMSLPEDDLLFLAVDITQKEALDEWVHNIATGQIRTVLAEANGKLIGHGTLNHNALQWTRHLGEIVLLINPDCRGIGLGNLLANELFSIARELGLQKIVARMASEQRGAIQVFERLGFRAEALLADYVIDRQGRTHDLIVMSYDVTGLTE